MPNGWDQSAQAWIDDMGTEGDFGRRYVLDPIMLKRALATSVTRALDIGCGEGRFCRMMSSHGISCVGIDPTARLLAEARRRDPGGSYVEAFAEHIPLEDATFDLVVSYLSLIDIKDISTAIPEMARLLKPGGRLLVANLNSFNTAGQKLGWIKDIVGRKKYFAIDHYLTESADWCELRGIRILNYHRPLSTYMKQFISQGLLLTYFDEPHPAPHTPPESASSYVRAPWFCVMEWQKPTQA